MTRKIGSCDKCGMNYPIEGLTECGGMEMCSHCEKGSCEDCGDSIRKPNSVVLVKECVSCGTRHNTLGAKIE